jgi:hypothetical protein
MNKNIRFKKKYEARVGEDGRGGTEVATVSAEDPDGRDNQLGFHLHSFVINSRCGLITVA